MFCEATAWLPSLTLHFPCSGTPLSYTRSRTQPSSRVAKTKWKHGVFPRPRLQTRPCDSCGWSRARPCGALWCPVVPTLPLLRRLMKGPHVKSRAALRLGPSRCLFGQVPGVCPSGGSRQLCLRNWVGCVCISPGAAPPATRNLRKKEKEPFHRSVWLTNWRSPAWLGFGELNRARGFQRKPHLMEDKEQTGAWQKEFIHQAGSEVLGAALVACLLPVSTDGASSSGARWELSPPTPH